MAILDLRIVTALKYLKQSIKEINNFTYVVDPSYPTEASRGAYANTAPFAFFSVTKDTLIGDAEVSEKRIVLYSEEEPKNGYLPSVISVMSDNFVPKPTVRELEVIIPYTTLWPLLSMPASQVHTMAALGDSFFTPSSTDSENIVATLVAAGSVTVLALNAFYVFLKAFEVSLSDMFSGNKSFLEIVKTEASNFVNFISGSVSSGIAETFAVGEVQDYNKDSLWNMHKRGALVRMKTFRGNQYVYGSIRNLKIWKEPLEESVYRGSFQFVERPILYIGNYIPEDGESSNSFVEAVASSPKGALL